MIPGVRLKYAVPAAAALGAVLGASGTPRAQARFDRMPLISKQASADFQPVNPAHRGDLHAAMGVPQGERISEESLRHVLATTENAHLRHMAQFALNARKWHHV